MDSLYILYLRYRNGKHKVFLAILRKLDLSNERKKRNAKRKGTYEIRKRNEGRLKKKKISIRLTSNRKSDFASRDNKLFAGEIFVAESVKATPGGINALDEFIEVPALVFIPVAACNFRPGENGLPYSGRSSS